MMAFAKLDKQPSGRTHTINCPLFLHSYFRELNERIRVAIVTMIYNLWDHLISAVQLMLSSRVRTGTGLL